MSVRFGGGGEMKKLRPILFSIPMVQAILEGRKTQTRRVVKPQGKAVCFDVVMGTNITDKWPRNLDAEGRWISDMKCTYGKVGDVLWVRESFTKSNNGTVLFRADATDATGQRWYSIEKGDPNKEVKWKPSIHMPFEAARIFLEITDVRVQRLQDITPIDARFEGIEYLERGDLSGWRNYMNEYATYASTMLSFVSLWKSINGEDSWNSNPWVWVVEFKHITKEEATK